jgi:hypothetical protein
MKNKHRFQNKSDLLMIYPPSRFIAAELWEVIRITIRTIGTIRKRVEPPALAGNRAHSLVSIQIAVSLLVIFSPGLNGVK